MAERSRQELLRFIDQLVPAYVLPVDPIAASRNVRSVYHWSEFMAFYDEDFVRHAYVCIFRREPDMSGLQSGLQALRVEKRSRVELLGRLRYSPEGHTHATVIKGLWLRYQLARWQRLPYVGSLVGVLVNLDGLSRPERRYDALKFSMAQQQEAVGVVMRQLSSHLGQVAANLGEDGDGSRQGGTADSASANASPPTLEQFLALAGVEFIVAAYQVVLGRAPHDQELESAVTRFLSGRESKILLLGKLCGRAEARIARKDIEGLPVAYCRERLFALPVIGFFLQLPRAVQVLSRGNTIVEFQQCEIAECGNEIRRFESHLMAHYNETAKHLKLKFVELVKPGSGT